MPIRIKLRIARRTLVLAAIVLVLGSVMLVDVGAGSQFMCPRAADPGIEEGWAAYGDQDMENARRHFEEAVGLCPRHVGGRTGLGYVELREGRTGEARALFDSVLDRDPDVVDALVGRGIVGWREDDLRRMEELLERALRLDPGNQEAQHFLGLLR